MIDGKPLNGSKADEAPKAPPPKPKRVRVRMAYGPHGGKARPWLVGPPLLSKTYRLCDCSTLVEPADAEKLLKGGDWLAGRVFVRDGDPTPDPKSE